jgi:hypothetical protein
MIRETLYGHWESLAGPMPLLCVGFVYRITDTVNNKKYIGQKILKFSKKLPPLKGRRRKRKISKPSDWEVYTGSSNELNVSIARFGKDKFKFEILTWCKNKTDLNYEEVRQIVLTDALYDPSYYNQYIFARIRVRKSST